MAYADYEYYTDVYGGRAVPAAEFPRLSARASKYMDKITFGRIAEADNDIKNCCCELTEFYAKNGTDGSSKTAESVGDYSVSYKSGASHDSRLRNICALWLPAELMYRGAGSCTF